MVPFLFWYSESQYFLSLLKRIQIRTNPPWKRAVAHQLRMQLEWAWKKCYIHTLSVLFPWSLVLLEHCVCGGRWSIFPVGSCLCLLSPREETAWQSQKLDGLENEKTWVLIPNQACELGHSLILFGSPFAHNGQNASQPPKIVGKKGLSKGLSAKQMVMLLKESSQNGW